MIRAQVMTFAVFALLAPGSAAALAQQVAPGPPVAAAQNEPRVVPLRVQVVLSRHQGEKKISSVPYMLSVSTHSKASQLRMGAKVPIRIGSFGKEAPIVQNFNYEDIGTSIDCYATALDDGRYQLTLGINESAPYDVEEGEAAHRPASFRSFASNQTIVLKDGQSAQFTMATDKVTGEVVRVEVTMTVLK